MRRVFLAAILAACAAAPAHACINDADTDVSEREFNKRYEAEDAAPGPGAPTFLMASGGIVLLLAGGGIVRRRLRG